MPKFVHSYVVLAVGCYQLQVQSREIRNCFLKEGKWVDLCVDLYSLLAFFATKTAVFVACSSPWVQIGQLWTTIDRITLRYRMKGEKN